MERITDELAICRVLYQFTQAQDRLDLAAMAAYFAPKRTVKFDLTKHFPEAGVMQGNASEICNILYEASAGWTATQHPVFNPVVTFTNATAATVQAMVQAYHCLEQGTEIDALTVRAMWHVDLEKIDSEWLIVGMAMVRDIPIANVVLFQKMQDAMQSGFKRQPLTQV